MGRNYYKKIHLVMYKSLTAALLVAASEAFIYQTDTTVLGAVVASKITSSTCKLTITNTTSAKTTSVVVAQSAVRAAEMVTANDTTSMVCSWQEAAAIWWAHVGKITLTTARTTVAPAATDG